MIYPIQNLKHFVVLMLENRSFDHMLGFLKYDGHPHPINGLSNRESNPVDPSAPASPRIPVTPSAVPHGDFAVDPDHTFAGTNTQIFGNPAGVDTGTYNQGFVLSYSNRPGVTEGTRGNVMKCWDPRRLPVLTTLAQEFAVCDNWFASVPGQTWPNRFYVHTATSDGLVQNGKSIDRRTIYDELDRKNIDWFIYHHSYPHVYTIKSVLHSGRTGPIADFWNDAAQGILPRYSFLEPEYGAPVIGPPNDQHPDDDVFRGERFIADVYEALRNSPHWEDTLLVVVYDEHGGLYDHVKPPKAVPPDDKIFDDGVIRFGFDRCGVRVPAILVSPHIPKGTVDSRGYDHTSILATARLAFGINNPLTRRDAAALTFEGNLSLDSIRDSPRYLPRPRDSQVQSATRPVHVNDLQASLVEHAAQVAGDEGVPVRARRVAYTYLQSAAPAMAFASSLRALPSEPVAEAATALEYDSEYRNGSFRAVSDSGEEILLVAGTHTLDFPYFGDAPWDNVLLAIGSQAYKLTSNAPGLVSIQFDANASSELVPCRIGVSGALQAGHGTDHVDVDLLLEGVARGFAPRNEGFIGVNGPGLRWHGFEFSATQGQVRIDSRSYRIVAAYGQVEHGRERNLKSADTAFYWDYVSLVSAAPRPYEYVWFQSHAIISDTAFGAWLESYLSRHAVAEITFEASTETNSNVHGVVRPAKGDSSVVIVENVVSLKLASLQRQLIRTIDSSGRILFGLREIFTPHTVDLRSDS